MPKHLRGAYSVPGWQGDPVRVFQWLRMWNLLLNPSAMSRANKNAFLERRLEVHGIDVDTLRNALMIYWFNEEAERRFRQFPRLQRRHPAA